MKTGRAAETMTVLLIFGGLGMAFGQGSLTPTRAPAPSMKTLTELNAAITAVSDAVEAVEARIDLATVDASSGYTHLITTSGSYYLSSNLAVTETNGVYIAAPDVTLDLNGFKISRASGAGGYGVYISVGADRATVKNGSVVGFANGIYISSSYPNYVYGCRFEKLTVSGCSEYGIKAGTSSQIINCCAHHNAGVGIYAYIGSIISRCISHENGSYAGISASQNSLVEHCIVSSHKGVGSASSGISVSYASTVQNYQIRLSSNTNTTSTASTGRGIYASSGSVVKGCVVSDNQGDGIAVYSGNCLVEGNNCKSNGRGYYEGDAAGIHVLYNYYNTGGNRIVDNNVTSNNRGIEVDSSGNFVAKNTAHSNSGGNYDIVGGNDVGTIQTSLVGAGSWDNFSF